MKRVSKTVTALADCAKHYIAIPRDTLKRKVEDWSCPYCRIAELEAVLNAFDQPCPNIHPFLFMTAKDDCLLCIRDKRIAELEGGLDPLNRQLSEIVVGQQDRIEELESRLQPINADDVNEWSSRRIKELEAQVKRIHPLVTKWMYEADDKQYSNSDSWVNGLRDCATELDDLMKASECLEEVSVPIIDENSFLKGHG